MCDYLTCVNRSLHIFLPTNSTVFFCLGITQEMDHHQLWLSRKMPKIVSEDVQINEDNCIDDKKEHHQEKAQVGLFKSNFQSYHFACIHR